MILDDNGKVVVKDHTIVMDETKLKAILILKAVGLQVTEDSCSWKIISQPRMIDWG